MFRVSRGYGAHRAPKGSHRRVRRRFRGCDAVPILLWQRCGNSPQRAAAERCLALVMRARFRSSRAQDPTRGDAIRRRARRSGFFVRRHCRAIPGFTARGASPIANGTRERRGTPNSASAPVSAMPSPRRPAERRHLIAAAPRAGVRGRRQGPTTVIRTPRDRAAVLSSRLGARANRKGAACRRAAASTVRMRLGRVSIIAA
jgi:hypothetical protein